MFALSVNVADFLLSFYPAQWEVLFPASHFLPLPHPHTHTLSPAPLPPQKIGKLRFTFFRLSDSTLFADIFLITSWFPPHPPPYVLSFDELRGSGRSSCSAAQRSAGSLKVCVGSWKLCRIFTLEMSVNELISCLYAHWFQRCDWSDCFCLPISNWPSVG